MVVREAWPKGFLSGYSAAELRSKVLIDALEEINNNTCTLECIDGKKACPACIASGALNEYRKGEK